MMPENLVQSDSVLRPQAETSPDQVTAAARDKSETILLTLTAWHMMRLTWWMIVWQKWSPHHHGMERPHIWACREGPPVTRPWQAPNDSDHRATTPAGSTHECLRKIFWISREQIYSPSFNSRQSAIFIADIYLNGSSLQMWDTERMAKCNAKMLGQPTTMNASGLIQFTGSYQAINSLHHHRKGNI